MTPRGAKPGSRSGKKRYSERHHQSLFGFIAAVPDREEAQPILIYVDEQGRTVRRFAYGATGNPVTRPDAAMRLAAFHLSRQAQFAYEARSDSEAAHGLRE